MSEKSGGNRVAIRYSEGFKVTIVRELEASGKPYEAMRRKYGIGGAATVQRWARQYGPGDLGKVIRVETPKEINEREQLKKRVKALEKLLVDAQLDLAIERACTECLCREAGTTVAEYKKKVGGKLPMVR